jgi:hypothetical protein
VNELSPESEQLQFISLFIFMSQEFYFSLLVQGRHAEFLLTFFLVVIIIAAACLLASLVYSSMMKLEAVCSSETSVNLYRTTRRLIPEDSTLLHTSLVNFINIVNNDRNLTDTRKLVQGTARNKHWIILTVR